MKRSKISQLSNNVKLKMNIIFNFLYFLFVSINCDDIRRILPFPRLREQIEEVTIQSTSSENPDSNLVSFLVQNVKEIFGAADEPTVLVDQVIDATTTESEVMTETESVNRAKVLNKINIFYKNISGVIDGCTHENILDTTNEGLTVRTEQFSKDLDVIVIPESEEIKLNPLESWYSKDRQETTSIPTPNYNASTKISCIFCNNIEVEYCDDPKNKLISSIVCEQDEDLCYSQHTPFGLVDRGCFNINRNITTYYCSCNLCNYIAISEMPHIFSRKQDWIEYVKEMSRLKRFRRSIFKDMSCLRCEINGTTKSEDILYSTNCLEGNIGSLPFQLCAKNEICAVKAIRSEGYMWRGCVSKPLYNYWWTLCDTDLCNYEALVSIFDQF
ncbi:uncharacterized protein LOC123713205 [Pieris brassicae]|uniref:uncharacterized protein LOC123713205 n=1 Tax=Pieris brassicae TaxID=7116 RepID=UPI001E6626C4|nr:uncharacterized protein LOC123713205 [Pieris brassicae]XP_045522725.1 uncharacterized protein LOC123713205 [Pieris brassicae]